MTAPEPKVSRWAHFRAWLGRQARGHRKDTIAIIVLAIAGTVMMLAIFTQQKASLPAWLPLVGEEFDHITAEFSTAQAVTPGQGQAVDIAGIQIGKVASVNLEEGHAVVGMDIEPKYMELIHPDASFLLRPKTNLNDMIVEIEPGTAKGHAEDGDNFTLAQTEPNTNLDAFLATLDADTRQYIQLLVAGGAQGIGGRGKQLSNALRRFQPFVHYTAKLNKAVAARHVALSRVIHNFNLVTEELARHDTAVKRFVTSSKDALGNFANQQQSVQAAFEEFPATLAAAQAGLASSNRFSQAAYPTLIKLIPQAQALTPAFKATERLFRETTPPIRDQIRPFTRQIRPVLKHSAEAAEPFEKTVRSFGNSLGGFNSFLNQLAYKPKGSKQSYLFYLPWLNHDFNAAFNLEDAGGPILRSLVVISCTGASLGYGFVNELTRQEKFFLQTLLEVINLPRKQEIPVSFPVPNDTGTCEYIENTK
jgi:phospholipid/cholesterol/gamma-HCH transport system substrate-binding protein